MINMIKKLFRKKKSPVLNRIKPNSYVKAVAQKMGVSYYEALKIMAPLKKERNISYTDFIKYKLYEYVGSEFDAAVERAVERIEHSHRIALKRLCAANRWSPEKAKAEAQRINKKFDINVLTYWNRQLFLKTDEEIQEWKDNKASIKRQNLNLIMKETGWTESEVLDHIAYCHLFYQVRTLEYYTNFRCWERTHEELSDFAVDPDSQELSNIYNKKTSVLYNKVLFNKTFHDYLGRKYWYNRNSSLEEFQEFTSGLDKIFCKPTNLSSGIGTKILSIPQDIEELEELYKTLINDTKMIAEELIIQHDELNKVYSGSVNTIRLTMVKKDDQCHRLWSFARFGMAGIVDNFHGGGMAAAVDVETGILISDAMNSNGDSFESHPVTGTRFKGLQIPYWDEVKEITEKALLSCEDVGYVGWDLAITPKGVVIVEGNSTPQVGIYQSILAPAGQRHIYTEFLNESPQ